MQLEYTEKEESVVRGKLAAFTLPASIKPLTHGEPILRIHPTPDGAIVTVREDGTVNYWSSKLQLRKTKSVFVSNFLFFILQNSDTNNMSMYATTILIIFWHSLINLMFLRTKDLSVSLIFLLIKNSFLFILNEIIK